MKCVENFIKKWNENKAISSWSSLEKSKPKLETSSSPLSSVWPQQRALLCIYWIAQKTRYRKAMEAVLLQLYKERSCFTDSTKVKVTVSGKTWVFTEYYKWDSQGSKRENTMELSSQSPLLNKAIGNDQFSRTAPSIQYLGSIFLNIEMAWLFGSQETLFIPKPWYFRLNGLIRKKIVSYCSGG